MRTPLRDSQSSTHKRNNRSPNLLFLSTKISDGGTSGCRGHAIVGSGCRGGELPGGHANNSRGAGGKLDDIELDACEVKFGGAPDKFKGGAEALDK
mmetsp:Transcript_94974/g.149525  ORF Transcript_94974/g.149525 Transcript_94974/m.149525 type:complete len:96 (+) Transcript_94974:1867-2154(+)